MNFQPRSAPIIALALALVSAACTQTPAGLSSAPFDPEATSDELEPVASVFGTSAAESFAVFGPQFTPAGAAAAAAVVPALAADPSSDSFAARTWTALSEMAPPLSPSSPTELIPQEYWGTTFVYVPDDGYVVDPERTDGPATGMRFVLYAVNPVTDAIIVPLTEIGYVDLSDESTETSVSVRLAVVSQGVTYLDYAVTATGVLNAPVFTIVGFATDGTERVDFSLTNALLVTFAGTRVNVDYIIDVANHDVHIDVSAELDAAQSGASLTVEATIRHGQQTVTLAGNITVDGEGAGQLVVTANDQPFATITITPNGISAVNPDGQPLTQREIDALENILDVLGETFEAFEQLLDPVEWLFPGN